MRRNKIPNNPGGTKPPTSTSKDLAFWIKTISFVSVCLLAIAALWFFIRPLIPISSTKLPDKITIGVLMINKKNEEPNYDELKNYLSKQSNTQFVLDAVAITDENALKTAQEKIAKKEWDIAFTTEPFTSIAAINEGYFFVARMSQASPLLQTAIIVRNDSAIKSLDNISTSTKLAMGDSNSVPFYYMPIYDLYGKGFKKISQQAPVLVNSIKALDNKLVDAAAVLYGNNFKDLEELRPLADLSKKINQGEYRVISLSRPIVPGSVYISPKLKDEKNFLEKLLLEVPVDIRSKAKYEVGQREEDYGFFKGLKKRVDTILDCAPDNPRTTNVYDLNLKEKPCPEDVEGTISGIRQSDSSRIELFVKSISTEYRVFLSPTALIEKLSKTFGSQNQGSLEALYSNLDKIKVKISKVSPSKTPKCEGQMTCFDFTDGLDESTKSRFQLEKINKSA